MLAVLDQVAILARDRLVADVIKDEAAPGLAHNQLFYSDRPVFAREGKRFHPFDCQVCNPASLLRLDRVQTHCNVFLGKNLEVLRIIF